MYSCIKCGKRVNGAMVIRDHGRKVFKEKCCSEKCLSDKITIPKESNYKKPWRLLEWFVERVVD